MSNGASRILVVDDERAVCDVISEELSSLGFACHAVSDSALARDILAHQRQDVMIADICMPHVSGIDLLSFSRRHAPACKVILITGLANRGHLASALFLGAYDYLQKPFKVGELARVVGQAVSGQGGMPLLPTRAAAAMEVEACSRQTSLESVRALVRAVEAKDPYTCRHSEHVAYYAANIAKAIAMPLAQLESLRVAALLHDVGKIGVPDHILSKPGRLTEAEFEHIRKHPAMGADILGNDLFRREAEFIRYHHERWDGQGYPAGLAGEEIPLASRVIQVADSMDAMLMQRSYKRAYTVEVMMGELVRCTGTQFDPRISAAAIQWARSNPELLLSPDAAIASELQAVTRNARHRDGFMEA